MAPRATVVIPLSLASFVGAALWIDSIAWFDPLREVMVEDAVPSKAVRKGPLGEILRTTGMVHPAFEDPRKEARWRAAGGHEVYRLTDDAWPLLDSVAPAEPFLHERWPLVSLSLDERNLNDPARGILTHWEQAWERPGHVSYFEGKEWKGSANCGVRLHGNSTREPRLRAIQGASYRLYFRDTYGGESLPLGLLNPLEEDPFAHLIVRGESALSSALSFDIVRQLGGDAPHMRPVLFVLNGELKGLKSFSEHLTKAMWRRHLGHNQFAFYRNRSDAPLLDRNAYWGFHKWVEATQPGQFSWERMGARVDLDGFVRHMFSILWCGTNDWAQGAAVLDRSEDEPRWRWINWDMDRSFRHDLPGSTTRTSRKLCMNLVLDDLLADPDLSPVLREQTLLQSTEVRGLLFRGLLRDDERFRRFFIDSCTSFMNHELGPEFLRERLNLYRSFEGTPGISPKSIRELIEFLTNRSAFFREELQRVFGAGESFEVTVTAPAGAQLRIDGHPHVAPYRGHYFAGQSVRVSSQGMHGSRTVNWRVGERIVSTMRLEEPVNGPLAIEWVE